MPQFYHVVIWFSLLVFVFGCVGTGIALWIILTHRYESYKAIHAEFLNQKQRVSESLRRARNASND